ncbi:MAG: hypothetical protein R8K53_09100 [Mariprofundaceae bacterium]
MYRLTARTSRIITVIKAFFVAAALLIAAPSPLHAEAVSADAQFDKTGDGLVNAEDWGQMSKAERLAYARASLAELGIEPDAAVGSGRTRLQDYLDGLRSVYTR